MVAWSSHSADELAHEDHACALDAPLAGALSAVSANEHGGVGGAYHLESCSYFVPLREAS